MFHHLCTRKNDVTHKHNFCVSCVYYFPPWKWISRKHAIRRNIYWQVTFISGSVIHSPSMTVSQSVKSSGQSSPPILKAPYCVVSGPKPIYQRWNQVVDLSLLPNTHHYSDPHYSSHQKYREWLKGLIVVTRNLILLMPNCSTWLCLGSAVCPIKIRIPAMLTNPDSGNAYSQNLFGNSDSPKR